MSSDYNPEENDDTQSEKSQDISIDLPEDNQTGSQIPITDELVHEIEKQDMEFWSFGILIFWIFPAVFFGIITQAGGFSLLFYLILGIYIDKNENTFSRLIRGGLFVFIKIFFGLKLKNADHRMIRFWWFFTFGYLISTAIIFLFGLTLQAVIPLILILWKRKVVLRYVFIVAFMPKTEYVWLTSAENRMKEDKKYDHLTEAEREYLAFNKPNMSTNFLAAIIIILSPVMIAFFEIPISIFLNISTSSSTPIAKLYNDALFYAPFGLLAIVPYFILNIRIFKGKKLSAAINTYFAKSIVKSLATTGLNALPFFKGQYYLEKENDILEMDSPTGFFAIFRKGRLFSIFVTPLAIMSVILKYTLENLDKSELVDKTAKTILQAVHNFLRNDPVFLVAVFILVPIIISILLPLIWTINSAEIKRASWRNMESEKQIEISEVEDLGKSLDSLFKIVIGVSAITNLASSISIVTNTDTTQSYALTGIILILVGIMVIPGTLTMAYMYFGSGDHVKGVNYLRYFLSRENKISVGTITRDYEDDRILVHPPSSVLIGFDLANIDMELADTTT